MTTADVTRPPAVIRSDAEERRIRWLGEPLPELRLSVEVFPPKTPALRDRLWATIERLRPLNPTYVSVTCGAGGNAADGTVEIVGALQERFGLEPAAHMTCAAAGRAEVEELARTYAWMGVRRIVALRGDAPKDAVRPADAFDYASDLVAALGRIGGFDVAVAGYPEAHPEAASLDADLDNLKRKVDAGASRIITQYCFDTDRVLRYRDALEARGVAAQLAVGVMPIHNFRQVANFSARCGAGVPDWLAAMYDGLDDDPATAAAVSTGVCAEQCRRLVAEGLTDIHFYVLNRAEVPLAVARLLGRRATPAYAA